MTPRESSSDLKKKSPFLEGKRHVKGKSSLDYATPSKRNLAIMHYEKRLKMRDILKESPSICSKGIENSPGGGFTVSLIY